MRVLTAESMRAVDARAVEEIGVPAPILMENAAIGVVEAVLDSYPRVERPLVLCGPGNNGGDGLAVARHLATRGIRPHAVVVASGDLSEDAEMQLGIARRLGLEVGECGPTEAADRVLELLASSDLVIDGLFGTGLSRPLAGEWERLVRVLDGIAQSVVAIDLPSGLDASSHRLPDAHVRADLSVTFVAPKVAHVLPPASLACGRVVIADLGVPEPFEGRGMDLEVLTAEELGGFLAPRPLESHKGSFGHLLVWAGSPGKGGAAVLAARAAGRAGAGLVSVASAAELLPVLEMGSLESMSVGLEAEGAEELAEELLAVVDGATAVAMGPGLGTDPVTRRAVKIVARKCAVPLLLDADALTAFAGSIESLQDRRSAAVLTPHPGELGRLLGVSSEEIQDDRLAAARDAAARSGCTVLLKGYRTLVADPDGRTAVVATGGPELASGGTGDVLAGIVGGLMASGLEPPDAARVGAYLHGATGEKVRRERGERGLLAADLITHLPATMIQLARA